MAKIILIIEDEVAIAQLLEAVFRDEGFGVLTAHNGKVALDLLADHTPDVIILDYMLPYMDGAAFVSQARRQHVLKETPILLLTAGRSEQWVRAVGAAACLQKPCDIHILLQWVRRLVAHTWYQTHMTDYPPCEEAAS